MHHKIVDDFVVLEQGHKKDRADTALVGCSGPMAQAREALGLFRDLTADAPDELATDTVLITMPDGTPVVGMVVCYNGPSEDGERILRPLTAR
jgi:hypothetical protein